MNNSILRAAMEENKLRIRAKLAENLDVNNNIERLITPVEEEDFEQTSIVSTKNEKNFLLNDDITALKKEILHLSSEEEECSSLLHESSRSSLSSNQCNNSKKEQSNLRDASVTIELETTKPGAYCMRGATIGERFGVGMITPYDAAISQKTKQFAAHRSLLGATHVSDDDDDDDGPSIGVNEMQYSRHGLYCSRNQIIAAGVASIGIILAIVLILVNLLPSSRVDGQNQNTKLTPQWQDIWNRCQDTNNTFQGDASTWGTSIHNRYMLLLEYVKVQETRTCNPQNLALLSMAMYDIDFINSSINNSTMSRYALSVVFFSLGGPMWPKRDQWLSKGPICSWQSVGCSNDNLQVVKELALDNNNLVGTLPTELYLLNSIRLLDLRQNEISGPLPNSIGNLTSLADLILTTTQISGPLPLELFALPRLRNLQLPKTTSIDSPTLSTSDFAALSNLETLLLFANHLGQTIPTDLTLLSNLQRLTIAGTLRGTLPHEVILLPRLKEIRIAQGFLQGSLPDQMFMTNKTWTRIEMSGNLLDGTIPSSIGLQTSLQLFDIGKNRISGSIPTEIGLCTSLSLLFLDRMSLTGPIPTEVSNLNALQNLDLQRTPLKGTVPTELAMLGNLKRFVMSGCGGLVGRLSPLFCDIPTIKLEIENKCSNIRGVEASRLLESCSDLTCCSVIQ